MKSLIKQYLDQGLSRRQLVSGLSAFGMSTVAAKAVAQNLAPPEFREVWRSVDRVEEVLPAMRDMPSLAFMTPPGVEEMT